MMKTFKQLVDDIILTRPIITITKDNLARISIRARVIADAKAQESHHRSDYAKRGERFETGIFGEVAVEQWLGIKFADLSAGPTSRYHVPDMKDYGLNIGIKTSDYQKNNTILIPREGHDGSLEPQIVVVRFSNTIAIAAGYASVDVLKTYRSDEYLKDKRAIGRKTGFYGYEHLKKFNSLEELKDLYEN